MATTRTSPQPIASPLPLAAPPTRAATTPATDPIPQGTRRTRPRQAVARPIPRVDVPRNAHGDRVFVADPTAVGGVFRGRAGREKGRLVTILAVTPEGRYRTTDGTLTRTTGANTVHRRYVRVGTDAAIMAAMTAGARKALADAEAAVAVARTVGRAATRKAQRRALPAMDAVVAVLPDPTVPRSERGRPLKDARRTAPDRPL